MKLEELELEKGKYYNINRKSDDFEYNHLKLIEIYNTCVGSIAIDSILHFINDEGINVFLDYYDILDICESKEKESKKKESKEKESKEYQCEIYFKNNRLYPEFKYDIYESLDGVIDLVHRNTKLDGVGYSKNGPYLRVLINNGETAYIKIKNIKKIEHVE